MTMSRLRKTFASLALVLTPMLALAHPGQSSGIHVHPVHDRGPKLHERGSQAHH